jgi:hypothetical protein
MSDLKTRALGGGVSVSVTDGKLTIYVNPAALAASKDLSAVGSIPIATVDLAQLEADTAAEGGRFWKRIKGWFKKK